MKKVVALMLFVSAVLSNAASAATGTLTGVTIQRLGVYEERFGGCMAELSKDISTVLPSCPGKWVTFACDGSLDNSVAKAMQKWDVAQLGYALGKPLLVQVDNSKTVNGYCFANIVRLEP